MRVESCMALLVLFAACDGQTTDPCVASAAKPVLEIATAADVATGATASSLLLADITLDGLPADTAELRADARWSIQRTSEGLTCGVPCSFGHTPGTYGFDVHATGFYQTTAEFVANYADIPAGCPSSHGAATQVAINLTEADSARAEFLFIPGARTGLALDIASVSFDDGTGPRTVDLRWPWPTFVTRNAGILHVRFVVGAPDTLAVGEIDLPLKKDWIWSVAAQVTDVNPAEQSFCVEARSFPLRRTISGADSLYIDWSGLPLSLRANC